MFTSGNYMMFKLNSRFHSKIKTRTIWLEGNKKVYLKRNHVKNSLEKNIKILITRDALEKICSFVVHLLDNCFF